MYHQLIKSITLFSDDKSVQLGIDNALYQLWIMAHFKELELQETKIFYQVRIFIEFLQQVLGNQLQHQLTTKIILEKQVKKKDS